MRRLSHSQIDKYLKCKRQWYLDKIEKLKIPQDMSFAHGGTVIHNIIEQYYKKNSSIPELKESFEKVWLDYKLDRSLIKDKKEEYWLMVLNAIQMKIKLTDTELKIFFDDFLSYLDGVDTDIDYFCDWKSSTRGPWNEEEYHQQLRRYAWMYYRKYGRLPSLGQCFYLKKLNNSIDYKPTLEDIQKVGQEIQEIQDDIEKRGTDKNNYPKCSKEVCNANRFCAFKEICEKDENLNIKIIIQNNYCFLEGNIPKLLLQGLDTAMKYDLKQKFFIQKQVVEKNHGLRPSNYDDIGTVHIFKTRHKMFPLGCLDKVKKIIIQYARYLKLDLSQCKCTVEDRRDKLVMNHKINLNLKKLNTDKVLRDYQLEAIEAFEKNKCFGYIQLPTGSGKTILTAEIIRRLDTRTLWIIDRKELLYQTKEQFEQLLDIEIGIIGDGECDIKNITVATIQTLSADINKYKDYLYTVNFVVVDEGHHASCDSYKDVFHELKNTKYRLATTATAYRDDKNEPVMFSLIGDILYTKKAEELIEKGYLMRPRLIFYNTTNVGQSDKYDEDYKISVSENPYRNELIKEIVEKNPDKKILILTKLVDHGALLNENIKRDSFHIHGSMDKILRRNYMELFKKSKNAVLVATVSIAGEGLDIPDLNFIINAAANNSEVRSVQIIGRELRKLIGKEEAIYVDFNDTGKYTKKHSYSRRNKFIKEGYKIEDT